MNRVTMLCTFCQHELDMVEGNCPHCGAAARRTGVPLGVRLRVLGVGVMMLFSATLLTNCVMSYFPGGSNSSYLQIISPQMPLSPAPNVKSPELQAQLQDWLHGIQQTQNAAEPIPIKH